MNLIIAIKLRGVGVNIKVRGSKIETLEFTPNLKFDIEL